MSERRIDPPSQNGAVESSVRARHTGDSERSAPGDAAFDVAGALPRTEADGPKPLTLFSGTDEPRVLKPSSAVLTFAPKAKVTEAYDAWWTYAFERQEIYFKRLQGEPAPWTEDEVLRQHRFTNVYRAADRVSQYLIRNIIYRDGLPAEPDEVVFRILLFKLFNRIETWETLVQSIGALTLSDDPFERIDEILARELQAGRRIYSAAYIMPTARGGKGGAKHSGHLALLKQMMVDGLADRLAEAGSMEAGFDLLRSYPGIGPFLAYQLITDINYSEVVDFRETEFVAAGPGAQEGIRKCFADAGGRSDEDLIRMMMDSQEVEFERLGLEFRDLFGRPMQLIDCQNVFCEVAKYARAKLPELTPEGGRKRIKQKFEAAGDVEVPVFPRKWGINNLVRGAADSWGLSRGSDPDFRAYQKHAGRTSRHGSVVGGDTITTPVLGLIGETGEVVSELKKRARDGEAYVSFRDRLVEELGDLIWYAADLATHRGFDLEEIDKAARSAVPQPGLERDWIKLTLALAEGTGRISRAYASLLAKDKTGFDTLLFDSLVALFANVRSLASVHGASLSEIVDRNLAKVQQRWALPDELPAISGDRWPEHERLPRRFDALLADNGGRVSVSFVIDGDRSSVQPDMLTDNAHDEDGYRFHDVFHFAYAAVLGWSPITRSLLRRKRKSDPVIDEVEDGGRAAAIEEGISALVFSSAKHHRMFDGIQTVDSNLLRTIRGMTAHLEVQERTDAEWQDAILQGYDAWREVLRAGGGFVRADRSARRIEFLDAHPQGHRRALLPASP